MNKKVIAVIAAVILIVMILIIAIATSSSSAPAALPAGVSNGEVVRCDQNGAIYLIQNGQKRWYNLNAWEAAGSPAATSVDCNVLGSIPDGPAM